MSVTQPGVLEWKSLQTYILQLCAGQIQVGVIDFVCEGPIPVMHILTSFVQLRIFVWMGGTRSMPSIPASVVHMIKAVAGSWGQ